MPLFKKWPTLPIKISHCALRSYMPVKKPVITWLQELQWKWGLLFNLQKGRPHDSSSGSGPNWGWAETLRFCWCISNSEVGVGTCNLGVGVPGVGMGLWGVGVVWVDVLPPLTISWLACKSLANGFSVSLERENETIKLTPSLDFREMVGLTSSPFYEEAKRVL